MTQFRKDLQDLINSNSKENGSNTPDYILAQYLDGCLTNFDNAVVLRDKHMGVDSTPGNISLISGDSDGTGHGAAEVAGAKRSPY